MNINEEIKSALKGNKTSLERVIISIQDNVYYLSLRMLGNKDDAQDATQDILIKIITNLSSFKFKSKFSTWTYRVASNHLLTCKAASKAHQNLNFGVFAQDLESDLIDPSQIQHAPDYQVLLNELRISCTTAMLLCLNKDMRLSYILGDILELEHQEASQVLAISKENFRKRLSRSRALVTNFTSKSCGLVSEQAKCSCPLKLTGAMERQRVDSRKLQYADDNTPTYQTIKTRLAETKIEIRNIELHRSVPHYKFPGGLFPVLEYIINEGIKKQKENSRLELLG